MFDALSACFLSTRLPPEVRTWAVKTLVSMFANNARETAPDMLFTDVHQHLPKCPSTKLKIHDQGMLSCIWHARRKLMSVWWVCCIFSRYRELMIWWPDLRWAVWYITDAATFLTYSISLLFIEYFTTFLTYSISLQCIEYVTTFSLDLNEVSIGMFEQGTVNFSM